MQSSGLLTPGTGRPYDNRQFVRWCYINYLRRDPADPNATLQDRNGRDFWTNTLNGHGDYNETIRAFLLSTDYRARFGPA